MMMKDGVNRQIENLNAMVVGPAVFCISTPLVVTNTAQYFESLSEALYSFLMCFNLYVDSIFDTSCIGLDYN